MATKQGPVAAAAGRAAWQVADMVRAETATGSTPDVIVFLADRLAMHIASQHNGEADDCNPCTQAIWRERIQSAAARTGTGPG